MINVAIIDDGVADDFLHSPIKHYIVRNNSVKVSHIMIDNESHGSKCAYIIEHQNTNVVFYDIKILNSFQKGTVTDLLVALNWCLVNEINVINLSIGTTEYEHYYSFCSICEKLRKRGCIVIAAFNNNGEYTLPAALPSVIGVKQFNMKSLFYDNFVDIYAFGQKFFLFGKRLIYCESCNSFACATVTATYISNLHHKKHYIIVRKRRMKYHWFDNLEDVYLYSGKLSKRLSIPTKVLAPRSVILVKKINYINDFICFLINNQKNIESVIWCGRIPLFVKLSCIYLGIKFWDETVYEQKNTNMPMKSIQSPPVVYVRGNSMVAEKVAANLRSLFFQDEYSCVCLSTVKTSYLRGILFMPCTVQNYELVNCTYNPSIIITIDNCKSDLIPDLIVDINNDHKFLLNFDDQQEILNSVDLLYSAITKILIK